MKKLDATELELLNKYIQYKENPILFMEECVYIPTPGESTLIKLYEPQKRIVKDFLENHDIIMLKSRQIGMSTITQAIITYLFTFYKNCVVGIVSRDASEASDFSRKVQDMIDLLPDWLRPKYKNKNTQYFILKNGCKLYSSAISPANPTSVFRSKSITLLVIDEAAHIRYIDEAWTGMASTVSKAQQAARDKGIPYGTIILSTPNKTNGIGLWFYKMWISAVNNENNFKPHKIHWSEIPDFVNDPNWYERQCKLLNNDKSKILQELELQFIGSEETLFSENTQIELQTIINQSEGKVVKIPGLSNYKDELLCFNDTINRKKFYLIGVDCASVAGKDFNAIEVMDYYSGEQVMEFKGKVDPKVLVKIIKYIVQIHCPNSLIIIENTGGYGHSVIYDLYYDEYPFNIYSTKKENSNNTIPGISTNLKTRPLILDALFTHVTEHPKSIKSKRLASELLNLVNKTGKVEADKGFHDDLAMAFAFCCYIRKYCRDEINTDEFTEEELQEYDVSNALDTILELYYNEAYDSDIIKQVQREFAYKENVSQSDFEERILEKFEENYVPNKHVLTVEDIRNITYDNDDIDLC